MSDKKETMKTPEDYYKQALEHNFIKRKLEELQKYDNYTYNHSLSVAKASLELGEKTGLKGMEMENLAYAALLHDIGKMKINKTIIQKDGVLTEKERRIIRLHPLYGAKQIYPKDIFPADVRTGILMHHENYNGTGYITKFHGREIPVIARIIRITDSYDAMQDDRPYQKHREKEEILQILEEEKGVSYDPEIFELFLQIKMKI